MALLKIAFWNANGLSQHALEVKTYLLTSQIDALLISETHFTTKSYLKIPNYQLYSVNHPDGKAHGGSAILIRDNVKHHQGRHYCTEEIQATNVIVQDWQGPLILSSLYSPPKHKLKKNDYVTFFNTLGNRYLACGDYNAKHTAWGSRLKNTKGIQLYSAIQNLCLNIISPGSPTHWPTDVRKTPDLIDFCICKGVSQSSSKCYTSTELSSDHSLCILTLNSKIHHSEKNCKLHNKKTNWSYFRYLIQTHLNLDISLKTENEIENAIEHFNETIQFAAWNSTPKNSYNNVAKLSAEVRNKLSEKRKARKTWQTTRLPADKTKLNRLIREVKSLLQAETDKNIESELKNIGPTKSTDYSLWKLTKNVNQQVKINHPLRKTNDSWTKSNCEKANTFAEHLKNVFTPNNAEQTPEYIVHSLNQIYQLDLPIQKFRRSEVANVINKLKPNKAPGYDLITGKTLKELPKEGLVFITSVFNACLTRNFMPLQWKVAQISMILKPGKGPQTVTSYRPISLLPIASKILETLFIKRLMPIIESTFIIPSHQFGFRKHHGTIEQVHRLVETIQDTFENKKYCTAAFLDISQAFDKVWHDGLLYKIKNLLPINYYTFIKSYLENRFFYVKEEDEMSSLNVINAGVPQGSVLGPTLYLLYTSDLPQSDGVVIGTFADDTAALAVDKSPKSASNKLQNCIDEISKWLKDWRIKANENKSVQVTFTLKKETCPPVTLNNNDIPQENVAKYLGMHLDRRLTWKKHIKSKRTALDLQLTKMNSLIGFHSKLSLENKLLIYKCILKPIWTYGIQLWGTASNSNLEILQRFQSKILRKVTNAPHYITNNQLHRELNVPTIKEEVKKQLLSYKSRIQHHPNPLAAVLMSNPATFVRLKRKAPQDLL